MKLCYNISMSNKTKGFTFLEVSLFLALSGAILIGILVGITSTLSSQRYNASVQDFAEFLRRTYTEVENPQSSHGGQDSQVLYGRLIIFGEDGDYTVHTYNVAGNDVAQNSVPASNDISQLRDELQNVNLRRIDDDNNDTYNVLWGAEIHSESGDRRYCGVLIVRMPSTGKIKTFWLKNDAIAATKANPDGKIDVSSASITDINFCVRSSDNPSSVDRNVRIIKDAQNADAVQIISQDGSDNQCAN